MSVERMFKYCLTISVGLVIVSCVEEFDADSQNFESILVVDARLNNKIEIQHVYLSRTFEFDSIPKPERNAQVVLTNTSGTSFQFVESSPGIYSSSAILQLIEGESYQLQIETQSGENYNSDFEQLPTEIAIDEVEAVRRVNNSGIDGVSILVNNNSDSSQPQFFRYEYEETYKIIAPDYSPFEWDEVDYDFFMNDEDGWEATIKPREEEARTCYTTDQSVELLLASTKDLTTNSLREYEVRFLSAGNHAISHRYSILVKQFHHTSDANSFFSSLLDFSGFDSVFSNVQTGLLEGNMNAVSSDAKVLGYFELSSYSEKRLFFNYGDLFPGEVLPPYIINCEPIGKPSLYPEGFHVTTINGELVLDGTNNSPLLDGIIAGLIGYVGENEDYQQIGPDGEPDRAPYLIKALGCVDCREFGSNVVPEFWIE